MLEITIPSKEESTVVKAYLSRREDKSEEILKVIESTFSTLIAINRPQRLSMSHERMAGMAFLAFEKKGLSQLI